MRSMVWSLILFAEVTSPVHQGMYVACAAQHATECIQPRTSGGTWPFPRTRRGKKIQLFKRFCCSGLSGGAREWLEWRGARVVASAFCERDIALMHYLLGSLNPLLASHPPEIQNIDFVDCSPTDLGWSCEETFAISPPRSERDLE